MSESKSCFGCKNNASYQDHESWEMPHITWWVFACAARPNVANLKQFPFEKTECPDWEPTA